MKRFVVFFVCLLMITGLCACNLGVEPPVVSAPASDVEGDGQSTTTTTTGALVVTDESGTPQTNVDGSLVTTQVTALPTIIRPVTNPNGSTVTKQDGTNKTEIVVLPHITVATDTKGTIHTSHVTEHTITTTTTTTTTATTTSTTAATTTSATTTSTTTSTTATTQSTQQEGTVILPAQGDMLDKRIMVGPVTLQGKTVTMVIINNSKAWESEPGSYFEYTCYDKDNKSLSVGKITFGYMKVKTQKTFTFEIPENTVKVAVTNIQADYWSIPIK